MKKNKKGQEFLVDIFSYLLFIMIILIFIIILVVQKAEVKKNVAVGTSGNYDETRLLILLKQPLLGTNKNIAECLIEEAYNINNICKKYNYKKQITNAFSDFGDGWRFTVYKEDSKGEESKIYSLGFNYEKKKTLKSLEAGFKSGVSIVLGGSPILLLGGNKKDSVIKLPGYGLDIIKIKLETWVLVV